MIARDRVRPLADVLEKELQADVKQIATVLGWRRSYHTFDSRRSDTGFPDLVLVRDRVVFCELKRERGKTTDVQREWLRALRKAGAEVYVVRPRNVDAFARVLGSRAGSGLVAEARGELLLELDRELAA